MDCTLYEKGPHGLLTFTHRIARLLCLLAGSFFFATLTKYADAAEKIVMASRVPDKNFFC